MKIRKAKLSDARKVSSMRKKTIEKILIKYHKKEMINELLKKNSLKFLRPKIKERDMFCLLDGNSLLGTIDLEDNKIGGLFIKYNQLRKGYGKKLMDFIEDYAKKKGIKKVKLYPTKNAMKFYKKLGYKVTKKDYWNGPGFRAYSPTMEKRLKQ